MRADVDDGIDSLLPEPEMERDIGMTRRARQVVIVGIAVPDITALRLNGDDRLAASDRGEMKGAVTAIGIILWCSPRARQIILELLGKTGERLAIFAHVPSQFTAQERVARRPHRLDVKSRRRKIRQQRLDRGQRIEADGMRDLMRTARIIREHQRKLLVLRGLAGKTVPGSDTRDDRRDAPGIRPMREMRELQIGIALARLLETHDAREQAAVDLRQHHVHREIAGRQAAQRQGPILAPRGG